MGGKEKGQSAFDEVTSESSSGTDSELDEKSDTGDPNEYTDKDTDNSATSDSGSTESQTDTVPTENEPISDISETSPSFPPDASNYTQAAYVTNDIWKEYRNFRFDVKLILRREYGITNTEIREVDQAIFTLIPQFIPPEVVAGQIVSQRGFSPEDNHLPENNTK